MTAADDLRARLRKMQSVGATILSNATYALKDVDTLEAQVGEPAPEPEPVPEPTLEPEPDPTPVPDGFPTPTTVGLKGAAPVATYGAMTITGDGTVLRGVKAGHILIRGATGVTIEDSDIGSVSISGAKQVTIRRNRVAGTVGSDGFHVTSDTGRVQDILIEGNYLGIPALQDGQHYDGIQVRGVDRLVLRGNTFDCGDGDARDTKITAAVFIQEANGGNDDVLVEGNLLRSNGYYVTRCGGKGIRYVSNVFARTSNPSAITTESYGYTATGNTWDDGTPVL